MPRSWWEDVVWFLGTSLLDTDLVYHSRKQRKRGEDYAQLADCGRILWRPKTGHDSIPMKRATADKIGRPCKQCFPEARQL